MREVIIRLSHYDGAIMLRYSTNLYDCMGLTRQTIIAFRYSRYRTKDLKIAKAYFFGDHYWSADSFKIGSKGKPS